MTEAQYQNWKRVRSGGLAHYLFGRISFWGGIPVGIVAGIFNDLLPTNDHHDRIARFVFNFLILTIAWALTDLFLGYLKWQKLEEEFQKRTDEIES